MIERAVAAGTPASWVAGDEVYGADPRLRAKVRELGLGYLPQPAPHLGHRIVGELDQMEMIYDEGGVGQQ